VKIANDRFSRDSAAYRDLLKRQLRAAQSDEVRTSQAIADFQRRHGLGDVATELSLSAENRSALQSRLEQKRADLSAAQAQLSSLQAQLQSTPAESSTSQKITTGRSSTTVDNTAANQLFESLQSQQATARAQVSGLSAEVGAIQSALSNSKSTAPLTQAQARLQQLALDQQVTQQTVQTLASQYQQARLNTVSNTVELTRVDSAIKPIFPIAPRRYMFLAVGLLLGMVLGFVSAQLGVLRRRPGDDADTDPDAGSDRGRDTVNLIDKTASREAVPVPAQRPRDEESLTDRILGNGRAGGRPLDGEH
jgi:uncharacterized protein involved in exopolysaccharide biosynthesis